MVRSPWQHGEPGGNVLAAGSVLPAVTTRTVLRLKLLASLSKTELYAGNSSHSRPVLAGRMTGSQNPSDKGTIRREGSSDGEPSETLRSDAS